MTPATQTVHAECDRLRALILDPDVWESAEMLAGVERLRTHLLLALGEPMCPDMPTSRADLNLNAKWG